MQTFRYEEGQLHCESVAVGDVARAVGTPFYLYGSSAIHDNYCAFEKALQTVPHLTCFAVKSNSNLAVLRLLREAGAGFDIVSGGELYRLLKVGANPAKVLFSGVGKTDAEIQSGIRAGILQFNVESEEELERIEAIASAGGGRVRVALRVNPDVDPGTHAYISTGLHTHKFGMPMPAARLLYGAASRFPHLDFTGISCHIGSQIVELGPFREALRALKDLVQGLGQSGRALRYLDIGGGLGVRYDQERPPTIDDYAAMLAEETAEMGLTLLLEPGRRIVAEAGILVTRVVLTKTTGTKKFVVVDAGMNDLIRPTLYGAFHAIEPVKSSEGAEEVVDVVGPICESGDFFAHDRALAPVRSGDLLAIRNAGAYGYSQASNYNSRPRIPEVMVRENRFRIVSERETYEDLIRLEHQ